MVLIINYNNLLSSKLKVSSSLEKYVCYVNPCHNGGRCVENPLQPCHCSRGFVGTYCQGKLGSWAFPSNNWLYRSMVWYFRVRIFFIYLTHFLSFCYIWKSSRSYFKLIISFLCLDHVCQPDPCLHGGSCTVTMAHPLGLHNNRWTYHCICSQYYRGRNCQSKVAENLALNGSYYHRDSFQPIFHLVQVNPCIRFNCGGNFHPNALVTKSPKIELLPSHPRGKTVYLRKCWAARLAKRTGTLTHWHRAAVINCFSTLTLRSWILSSYSTLKSCS